MPIQGKAGQGQLRGHDCGGPRAAIFLAAGFGAHMYRPVYADMLNELRSCSFAVVTLDIVGHGYSDGERCYIANHEDVVEDWLLCISSAFKNLPQVPWFVAGQSMGGTFALAVAHKCNNLKAGAKDGYFSRFSGCISICPSLKVSIPPSPIVALLRAVLPLIRFQIMPQFMNPVKGNTFLWKSREVESWIINKDRWGVPGALGWGLGMRWGMADTLMRLISHVNNLAPQIQYPFLIIQDPDDKICNFEGAEIFFASARRCKSKHICRIVDGAHDLMCNEPAAVAIAIDNWIVALSKKNKKN